jgi:predicted ATPase/DNA-binding SARP family transcriptional activator
LLERAGGRSSGGRAAVERWSKRLLLVCRVPFGDDGRVEFRLLGPLEVVADGRVVALGRPKPRALLAILLLRANEPVSSDVLIEELWAGRPPVSATKVLQTYVSQLRRALGRSVIETVQSAYELRTDDGSLDLHRVEQLMQNARAAGPEEASAILREALLLWRGPALAEFAGESWAQPEIDRLEELRLEALQERIEADLALGASAELIGELELLVGQYPLRESLRGQLMLALYRSGRQAEALAAYRDARGALVDALGIEPALALRQLERRILEQDPGLELAAAEPPATRGAQPTPDLRSRSASFVGRTRELREIRELLRREDVRLLTLTGAAGSGKTRLALEATRVLEGESAGAVLVELAHIADARLVARTIAGELAAKELPGRGAREALLESLRDRRMLLLLDNFEHVLSAAPLVRELLAGAAGLKVLVTSRAPLAVPEERIYQVPALELPDPLRRPSLARVRRTEAIRLFVDRARTARHGFELTEANAESVVELCVRLDGLPLALELAAARCNLLSPRALLERLDSRLDLLRAAPGSGVTERQWTLRGAIEWSYELLDPEQQRLFTSLGVFVAGFTLSGAELVAGQPGLDTVEGIESLLRNNLLTTEHAGGDEPRLGMLETIREYALERLEARGDGRDVRRRHADFYFALAEEAELGLMGPQQREWLERLDAELDNIRAALTWALDEGEAEVGLRIASGLWRFWQMRNYEQEGRERLEELLALGSGSPSARAKAQTFVGSLSLHRRLGDTRMISSTLGLLAVTGDWGDSGLALSREALEVAREGDDPYALGHALWHVGSALAAVGELDEAEGTLGEAVDVARRLGNVRSVGSWQKTLGGIALMRGDHPRARLLFEDSLAIHRSLDDALGVSHSLSNLAFLALEAGDDETARTLLSEALAIERRSGHQPRLANALEMSARLAAADGQPALAIRLYACAALLRERVSGLTFEVGWPDPAPDLDDLRDRVGEATFEKEWERGCAMTLLEAIDEARGDQPEPAQQTELPGTASCG